MLELRAKAAKVADAGATKITNTRDRMSSQPSKNINWDADVRAKPPPPPLPGTPKAPAFLPPPSRTSSSPNSATSSAKSPPPPVPLRRAGPSAAPQKPLSRSDNQLSHASSHSSSPPPPPLASSRTSGSPSVSPGPPPTVRRETRPDAAKPTISSTDSLPRIMEPPAVALHETDPVDRIDWADLSPEDKDVFFSWLDEFFARLLKVPVPPRSTVEAVKHSMRVPPSDRTPSPMAGPVSRVMHFTLARRG